MNVEDLKGADWHKIDSYALHMLEDQSKPFESYSGTLEGWVQMMVERSRFSDVSVPFLFRIKDITLWPESGVAGLKLYSRIGNICAASGTFEAILTLAKDPNVLSLEASRPGYTDE